MFRVAANILRSDARAHDLHSFVVLRESLAHKAT